MSIYHPCHVHFGALSNFFGMPIKDERTGVVYPTMQHAIYGSLLANPECILPISDPYVLKRELEKKFQEQLRAKMATFAKLALQKVGVDEYYGVFSYQPSSSIERSKYALYWGVDEHGYGWNIWGRCLRPQHPTMINLFMLHQVTELLVSKLDMGDRLTDFLKASVQEIVDTYHLEGDSEEEKAVHIKHFIHQYRQKTLENIDLYELAYQYPGGLVHFIRKKYAPLMNARLRKRMASELFHCLQMHMIQKYRHCQFQVTLSEEMIQNILFLYENGKLQVPISVQKRIGQLKSIMWTEEEVREAVRFIPRCHVSPVIHEANHRLLSPLSPQKDLVHDGHTFQHHFHLVYYLLFAEFDKDHAYSWTQRVKDWTSGEADLLLEQLQIKFMYQRTRSLLQEKFKDPWFRWVLLTSAKAQYDDPYDPSMSHMMNGLLEELYHEYRQSPEIQQMHMMTGETIPLSLYASFYRQSMNKALWKRCFHIENASLEKKFHTIFNTNDLDDKRYRVLEILCSRLQKEVKGSLLCYVKKKGLAKKMAEILHYTCFPESMLMASSMATNDKPVFIDSFFDEVWNHRKVIEADNDCPLVHKYLSEEKKTRLMLLSSKSCHLIS